MQGLPAGFETRKGDQISAIACPDCNGVLSFRVEGHRHLHFICRVGHTYSVPELIESKEEVLEKRLWALDVVLEEIAALLRDLDASAPTLGRREVGGPYDDRITRAARDSRTVREIIERNVPVSFSDAVSHFTDANDDMTTGAGGAGGPR